MYQLAAHEDRVSSLIDTFIRNLPSLKTKTGAKNKCKFVSYELCCYLRRRGVRATMVHLQGIVDKKRFPQAHQEWQSRESKDWSHYVVKIGSSYYDLTKRQFDPKSNLPSISTLPKLKTEWALVETDDFINSWITEIVDIRDYQRLPARSPQVKT